MFCYVSNNEQIACCICCFCLAVELVHAHAGSRSPWASLQDALARFDELLRFCSYGA